MSEPQLPPWEQTNVVGERIPRIDAFERVSGAAVYTIDVNLPGMLHAAILRCPHAHATVKRVDMRAALTMPGVRGGISAMDPEARIELPRAWWVDDGPLANLFETKCRYAGEEVAAIVAETPYQAADAMKRIEVDYEPLPFVLDMEAALAEDAPAVHDGGNLVRNPEKYERGNVDQGLKEADVVVEETYRTAAEIQTPLEPHGTVAAWEGGRLTVFESCQGVFQQQQALAQVFGLPLSSVRVICKYVGGAFGAKAETSKHTLIAALLARKIGRPVKLTVTREDSFSSVGSRPANSIWLKAGVKKDGTITAFEMKFLGSVGAYSEFAGGGDQVLTLYRCANVRTVQREVYTNTGKVRAFRGPQAVQTSWALEQMMDTLAERIGMDPVEFRMKNVSMTDQIQNRPFTTNGLAECLQQAADRFGWKEARSRQHGNGPVVRGVGMAAACWDVTQNPPGTAILILSSDGTATLEVGNTDIGTGTKTVFAMIVAEELGIPVQNIRLEWADTATTPYSQNSGGSGTVCRASPAVRAAAVDVRTQLLAFAAADLAVPVETLQVADGAVVSGSRRVLFADLKSFRQQRQITGVGRRLRNVTNKPVCGFAAHFAEVEVNTKTGEVKVLRLVGAHDSGRVMNRLTYESQVFGGMTMGVGFGLMEQRVIDAKSGRVLTANLHDYKIPTAGDIPADKTCIGVDLHDRESNTVGAKGIGEISTVPTAPAIANAVYHATGVRMTGTPMSPMALLAKLSGKG